MTDAQNNAVNCDVDFCSWQHAVWGDGVCDLSATVADPAAFAAISLVTGDVNADGVFNILDLIAAKRYSAGVRDELNMEALGVSGNTLTAEHLVTLKRWLMNGPSVVTKDQLLAKIATAADNDGYVLGLHTCGDTDIEGCINNFETAMDEMPGYVDFDMCSLPFISQDSINHAVTELTRLALRGVGSSDSFITLTAHWVTPTVNIADASNRGAHNSRSDLTPAQYNAVMTPGTTENSNFLQELAIEAAFIQKLKDNGVSVIFRPMHEGNQAFFWWCVNKEAGITPAMYAQLYRYVHEYFTVTCGLDNIVWEFGMDQVGFDSEVVSAMYPGNDYVDMVSIDWYLGAYNDINRIVSVYNDLMTISGNKPFAIAELGGYSDYDLYNIPFDTTLGYIQQAINGGMKVAYVGPYLNWSDITR